MSGLMDIKTDVQNIADAIASVIGVDVTIVDHNLIRVAGTGGYSRLVGQAVDGSSVFRKVLETGRGFLVENPRHDKLCADCGLKGHCRETGEVSTPVTSGGRAVGVIGLVAFNRVQRDRLFADVNNLMAFLEKMADFLAVKLSEKAQKDALEMMTNQMNTIIDSIDEGIIATNSEGNIIQYNQSAGMLFNLSESRRPINIKQLFPEFKYLLGELPQLTNIKNREFLHQRDNLLIRGIYSVKPVMFEEAITGLVFTIREISQVHKVVNDAIGSAYKTSFDTIIGQSPAILDVKEKAMKAAASSSTVMIQGESGTGKELFARAIHSASPRKNKPFVAINCAAIPEQLLESELFGYDEGAFTGAIRGGRSGKFELADGGTLFLDEIGDMPLHLQAKLLRVLQERKVDRLGGKVSIPVDVRIIAATNSDLEKRVSTGEFREDLFFRLNVIPLNIPPLRQRSEDIPILMDYLLRKCNEKLGKDIEGFSMDVFWLFLRHKWKGNVRELENTIEYAVNMEQGSFITPASLPVRFRQVSEHSIGVKDDGIITIEQAEREAIVKALEACDTMDQAANALGIGRATLFRKVKRYGLKG